ncbi:hypothetical protein GCM10009020_07160 [Natronoarchaeum mannanilyticum]|uniref:Uncharacterized protein n=1 Tax=Natronoarchaeum mannanilyticum TaxID=926360 RepID=A0AAV3T7C6_9EURY
MGLKGQCAPVEWQAGGRLKHPSDGRTTLVGPIGSAPFLWRRRFDGVMSWTELFDRTERWDVDENDVSDALARHREKGDADE